MDRFFFFKYSSVEFLFSLVCYFEIETLECDLNASTVADTQELTNSSWGIVRYLPVVGYHLRKLM